MYVFFGVEIVSKHQRDLIQLSFSSVSQREARRVAHVVSKLYHSQRDFEKKKKKRKPLGQTKLNQMKK
jgi:hypothetical protein